MNKLKENSKYKSIGEVAEILELIKTLSPSEEPGIRKYFLEAPTESWNPKTGSYALNLSWVYELDS